jgi:hypothetical protein
MIVRGKGPVPKVRRIGCLQKRLAQPAGRESSTTTLLCEHLQLRLSSIAAMRARMEALIDDIEIHSFDRLLALSRWILCAN